MNETQIAKAEAFRKLHHGGETLVLLNCWDAGSARIFELAGARAIATTSSGLGNSVGYPDGQKIPRDQLLNAVRQITRVVKIPVSVDLERGFSSDPAQVAEFVWSVIEAGGIGMNIEDGPDDPDLLASKIKAVRKLTGERGFPFFINARADVYLRGICPEEKRFDETIRRIHLYA